MIFKEFPKIPRLNREIVITEKIDGTNAALVIVQEFEVSSQPGGPFTERVNTHPYEIARASGLVMFAQSRSKFIKPGEDNFGFATWAAENSTELFKLGPGEHYGEWWGAGINKRYQGAPKKFSLFNTHKWSDVNTRPTVCDVVPTLYQGPFSQSRIDQALTGLRERGSVVWPACTKPEGIIIYHTAAKQLFKVTCEKDESPKSAT